MFFTCRLRHPECVPLSVPDDLNGNKYRSSVLIMTIEPKGFEAHSDTLLSLYNNLKDFDNIGTLGDVETELSSMEMPYLEWIEIKVSYPRTSMLAFD